KALALMELSQVGYTLAGAALTTYPGAAYGVIQDLHNDVIGLVDLQGKLREFYNYDVYGSRTQRTNAKGSSQCVSTITEPCPSENGHPLGCTGRPLSPLTGLYGLRFRQYDPHLRMFLSADPLGYAASGFDLWLYVGGDPLNYIDPFGLEKTDPNEGKERFTPHAAAPLDTKRVPVEDRATKPGSKGDLHDKLKAVSDAGKKVIEDGDEETFGQGDVGTAKSGVESLDRRLTAAGSICQQSSNAGINTACDDLQELLDRLYPTGGTGPSPPKTIDVGTDKAGATGKPDSIYVHVHTDTGEAIQ